MVDNTYYISLFNSYELKSNIYHSTVTALTSFIYPYRIPSFTSRNQILPLHAYQDAFFYRCHLLYRSFPPCRPSLHLRLSNPLPSDPSEFPRIRKLLYKPPNSPNHLLTKPIYRLSIAATILLHAPKPSSTALAQFLQPLIPALPPVTLTRRFWTQQCARLLARVSRTGRWLLPLSQWMIERRHHLQEV